MISKASTRFLHLLFVASLAGAAFAAAEGGKDSKAQRKGGAKAPAGGVKTPGVLIPISSLKNDAALELTSAPAGLYFAADAVSVADETAIKRFDLKTNKAFEPSRDANDVKKACGGLVFAFGHLWTATCGAQPALAKVEVLKPASFSAIEAAPSARNALAASADSLWLLVDHKTSLQRLDPQTSQVVADVRLPSACEAILFAEDALWVVCPGEPRLLRINPATNVVEKRIDVPAEPVAIAAGESSIWVLGRKEGKIARVDPKTNKVTATIELGLSAVNGTLAFGEGFLWASAPGFPLMRISPANDKVVQQFYGEGGGWIAFGAGSLWVGARNSHSLLRFDPKRVQATLAE